MTAAILFNPYDLTVHFKVNWIWLEIDLFC